jgi:hypothetical protein
MASGPRQGSTSCAYRKAFPDFVSWLPILPNMVHDYDTFEDAAKDYSMKYPPVSM